MPYGNRTTQISRRGNFINRHLVHPITSISFPYKYPIFSKYGLSRSNSDLKTSLIQHFYRNQVLLDVRHEQSVLESELLLRRKVDLHCAFAANVSKGAVSHRNLLSVHNFDILEHI